MSAEVGGPGPASGDQFDAALRSLIDGTAGDARFRELSAADRAKQAKKSQKRAERDRVKRARGQSSARRRRRSPIKITTAIAIPAALICGGLYAYSHHKWGNGLTAQSRAANPLASAPRLTANLFAGTSAENWANGAPGIVLPVAHAVGPYSAAQVASAYATTKRLLIAGNLDRPVLFGARPTAFADLLSKQQRTEFLTGLNAKGVWKDGSARNTHSWITTFAPGSAELIGDVIKVHGTMSAKVAHVSGTTALRITVNYLFVYPVESPAKPWDWMRVVGHEYGNFDFARWDSSSGPIEPWQQTSLDRAGDNCRVNDGYIHPEYPYSTPDVNATGPVVDPYSLAHPPARNRATCFHTNGT